MKHLLFCMLALGLMGSASALAAGSDELWEVSIKTDMPGMPADTGSTGRYCRKKGDENSPNHIDHKVTEMDKKMEKEMEKEMDCKVSDVKDSGNKSSFKTKCGGKHPMTMSSETTTHGDGSYITKTQTHSKEGDSTTIEEWKLVGTCNFETDRTH